VWRFLAGFGSASVLWGALLFSYKQGWIDISLGPDAPPGDEASAADAAPDDTPAKAERTRKKRQPQLKRARPAAASGERLVGDDLGENSVKPLDVGKNGGEEQLRGTEIEQAFDNAFPQIRRCLVLAASDDPAQGKLTFGLRIAGSGKVTAVNLAGPAAVAQGEAGACLRKAASGIHFRSFNGPDMVIHYPLTLE